MKTKQIYYEDSYQKEIKCNILSVEPKGILLNVVLDQTIFYPEGGGQSSDKGHIGEAKVEYVRLSDGEIIHQVQGELKTGENVTALLDWNWRYKYMKIHTAGHALHDVLMTMFEGLYPIRGSHGKKAFLEYQGELDASKKDEIEKKVNEALQADLPVNTKESTYDELEKECRFLPPHLPKDKPLRMIKIGSYAPMPDGGVHVKTTKEIGTIWIANISSQEGKVKIRYGVAG
ncbi:MAG: Threonyl/alanyl tRNA synthetase SAD [Candidatus Roizmanbacteria bacterium GW2011_GWA2_37_7]|uniref:Threonyl/alanyl tRNA synthetase SAD n=1 Tax=Candidatus Roizmanbacteria bacterium GW2011_GWA2_37_7 TaxID=1618481 RepID=A0A0G0HIM5_9BACT|nr:MAG: Threonyl/alanyl tRNA synthetase SAD [Candidatus Roizmanbacteria bacterium GW2011_GWA2_37_7]